MIFTVVIFLLTYLWLATEKTPRHLVVLVGASTLILGGVLTPQEAFQEIHWSTLLFLLSVFVLTELLSMAGIFKWLGSVITRQMRHNSKQVFWILPLLTALLSMVLNNMVVMVVMGVLTLELCASLAMDPSLLIIMEVCSANIGGGATLIGSPSNLMMAGVMGYGFSHVLRYMMPIMSINFILVMGIFCQRRALALAGGTVQPAESKIMEERPRDWSQILWKIDWQTLIFFMGLFIIVGALNKSGVFHLLAGTVLRIHSPGLILLAFLWFSAIISAFVDNVPMALSMAFTIKAMQGIAGAPPESILVWSSLIGLSLGGNVTPIGAAPNVVAYGLFERLHIHIGWRKWIGFALPPTLIALLASSLLLCVMYHYGQY